MKTFMDLVKTRFSVRAYRNERVEKEKIERCLEAARLAPSGCNAQPWHFIVAEEPELVKSLAEKTLLTFTKLNRFVAQAPVIVAVVGERPNITSQIGSVLKDKQFYLIDLGIAAEHFCLQAVEEGLGTCLLGWFNEKAVGKHLNVPKGKRVLFLISLGYPEKNEVPEKRRKDFDSIVSWNGYGS